MLSSVFNHYEAMFRELSPRPRSALEVGALPDHRCLLSSDTLDDIPWRVGINLTLSGNVGAVEILEGDARDMPFEDGSFDLVVSSSTLEHIPNFWRAVSEIHRVLAPGGTLIINVPGYIETTLGRRLRKLAFKVGLPDFYKRATRTFYVHDAPHDYYRFSRHAMADVILDGLEDVEIWSIMTPPRLFGRGRKSGGGDAP